MPRLMIARRGTAQVAGKKIEVRLAKVAARLVETVEGTLVY